jgi:cyclopropane-fatty-acyl-phospholipid synthase
MLTERLLKNFIDDINETAREKVIGVKLPDRFVYPEGAKNYVVVKNPSVVKRFFKDPEMAFGEAYMDGDIEIEGDLEEVLTHGVRYLRKNEKRGTAFFKLLKIFSHLDTEKDKKNVQYHYDIGNDFYKLWLDRSMTYSCAFFSPPDISLEEAQAKKREISLKKLLPNKNDILLDIGCGWGSALFDAVEKFNVKKAVGITLSENQYRYILEKAKRRGLEERIEAHLMHYKDLPKLGIKFTKVISIGMFEHVGRENYKTFFETVYDVMEEKGLFLLHTIGKMHPEKPSEWIRKYIFPGGYLPALEEILKALEHLEFYLIDIDNWRLHYYKTLKEWKERFYARKEWVFKNLGKRFFRMWDFYLTASAVSFLVGSNYVFQILLSKDVVNDYPVLERKFGPSLL